MVVELEFFELLDHARRSSAEDIDTERRFTHLRDVELDLIGGFRDSIGGPNWLNGNHYTFFVLNVKDAYLGYGDSLTVGCGMPAGVKSVFTWWIDRLRQKGLRRTPELTEHWFCELPVAFQHNDDDFSCGMLALNGVTA